jgi:hypothetical protein
MWYSGQRRRGFGLRCLAFASLLVGCGLQQSQYIDYSPDDASKADEVPDCAEGLKGFQENVASGVDGTCASSSCHGSTAIAGKVLIKADNANNRKALLGFKDSDGTLDVDGTVLFAFISDGKKHKGNDQSAALPKANLEAWKKAEATCK